MAMILSASVQMQQVIAMLAVVLLFIKVIKQCILLDLLGSVATLHLVPM